MRACILGAMPVTATSQLTGPEAFEQVPFPSEPGVSCLFVQIAASSREWAPTTCPACRAQPTNHHLGCHVHRNMQ